MHILMHAVQTVAPYSAGRRVQRVAYEYPSSFPMNI